MDMETEIQMLAQSMTGADQGEQDYLAALCAALAVYRTERTAAAGRR